MGDTLSKDGFEVMLRGFQNSQSMPSQVIISAKNTENDVKTFRLNPPPVLIDEFGNQYDMFWIDRSSQIRMTPIYPGIVRGGTIFFEPINPDAKYLHMILYLNEKKYEFDFKAASKTVDEKDLRGNISNITRIINATMGETITQGGFQIKLISFENTPGVTSKVYISVKNMEKEEKTFNFYFHPQS